MVDASRVPLPSPVETEKRREGPDVCRAEQCPDGKNLLMTLSLATVLCRLALPLRSQAEQPSAVPNGLRVATIVSAVITQ